MSPASTLHPTRRTKSACRDAHPDASEAAAAAVRRGRLLPRARTADGRFRCIGDDDIGAQQPTYRRPKDGVPAIFVSANGHVNRRRSSGKTQKKKRNERILSFFFFLRTLCFFRRGQAIRPTWRSCTRPAERRPARWKKPPG